ncbi:DUF559 domain-containing protein [Litchfieldella xinjiangensis]|uniref:DUF559 domain-containing protein n=1 Tax=Litchfieldella xinjiangensis TaxID=1166948 RepID=UPI0005BB96C3|nr:DUF559 domain-containing protein [Halomonas xinjiangensis]
MKPFIDKKFHFTAPLQRPEALHTGKNQEWLQACRLVEAHNEQRLEALRTLLDQQFDNEFWQYEKEARISRLFQDLNITLLPEEKIEAKRERGYMTAYEEFIFQSLKRHYTLFRQVNIDGRYIDFLVVLSKPYRLWALEVDGDIHRRKAVADTDASKEIHLSRLGIYLIRLSNRCITKDHRQAVDRVIEELRQG